MIKVLAFTPADTMKATSLVQPERNRTRWPLNLTTHLSFASWLIPTEVVRFPPQVGQKMSVQPFVPTEILLMSSLKILIDMGKDRRLATGQVTG